MLAISNQPKPAARAASGGNTRRVSTSRGIVPRSVPSPSGLNVWAALGQMIHANKHALRRVQFHQAKKALDFPHPIRLLQLRLAMSGCLALFGWAGALLIASVAAAVFQHVSGRPHPLSIAVTERIKMIRAEISSLSGVDDFVKISKLRRGIVNLEKLQAETGAASLSLAKLVVPTAVHAIEMLAVAVVGLLTSWVYGFGPVAHVPPAWLFPFATLLAWPSPAGSISIHAFLIGWSIVMAPVARLLSGAIAERAQSVLLDRDVAALGGPEAIQLQIAAAEHRRIAGARGKSD